MRALYTGCRPRTRHWTSGCWPRLKPGWAERAAAAASMEKLRHMAEREFVTPLGEALAALEWLTSISAFQLIVRKPLTTGRISSTYWQSSHSLTRFETIAGSTGSSKNCIFPGDRSDGQRRKTASTTKV